MNTHNPMQILRDEHEVICLAENIIKSLDKSWEQDETKYLKNVTDLLKFFREYSDHFHHYKEEDVLFKELKNNPGFMLHEIITELEEHHIGFRESVVEISEALVRREWTAAQNLLNHYINNLLDHIAVENDELFIMAESVFSVEELERMYFKFEDIDNNLNKKKKKELEQSLTIFNNI